MKGKVNEDDTLCFPKRSIHTIFFFFVPTLKDYICIALFAIFMKYKVYTYMYIYILHI